MVAWHRAMLVGLVLAGANNRKATESLLRRVWKVAEVSPSNAFDSGPLKDDRHHRVPGIPDPSTGPSQVDLALQSPWRVRQWHCSEI